VPGAPELVEPEFFRPPLAKDLFSDRGNFGKVLLEFKEATPLVMELERRLKTPEGPTLEQELERFQEEGETTYPPRLEQLTAVRFYLQRILWECSTHWQEERYGKNNYVELLHRLDVWGHTQNERVAIVTFNYDTLVDDAFSSVFRRPLNNVDNFMDEKASLFKVHGSVNWGRRVSGLSTPGRFSIKPVDDAVGLAKANRIRHMLIRETRSLTIGDEFEVLDEHLTPITPAGEPLFPALAIPFATKRAFECPPGHLKALEALLPEVNRVLVIGWRGNEQHFLKLLDQVRGKAPRILIVGRKTTGVAETSHHLESVGFAPDNIHSHEDGFSNFLEDDSLEEFLRAPIQG
jgi:hypothetical protein